MTDRKLEKKQPLVVLAGPTAAGKSSLAVRCAPLLNAEIISADSAQVYRYLDIGTAKVTTEERSRVKHHLLDIVDPGQDYSVADYQKEAVRAIDKVRKKGKLPLLVGGTGLYIRALIRGYTFCPEGKSPLREELNRRAREEGLHRLYEELLEVDPRGGANINPQDQRRIVRALEVYYREGKPISRQVEETTHREQPFNTVIFALTAPRDLLYRRIERRVDQMIDLGFKDEVNNILEMGYSRGCPGLQILGYRQMVEHLTGEKSLAEIVSEIKKQTRRLAKRQMTWFRKEKGVIWLEREEERDNSYLVEIIYKEVQEILSYYENNN